MSLSFETPSRSIRGWVRRLMNGSPARGVSRVMRGFGGAARRGARGGVFAGRLGAPVLISPRSAGGSPGCPGPSLGFTQSGVTSVPGFEQITEPGNDMPASPR